MINERLLAALMGQSQPQSQSRPGSSRLAQVMARRGGKADAKYASLAALPPYGEIQHADRLGGTGSSAPFGSGDAFQSDAYQNDAYQV